MLIGFNIRPDETVQRLAENEGVDLRFYQVIYEIEDDLKQGDARHARADRARGHARPRRSAPGLQGQPRRHDRRLLRQLSGKITRNAKVRVMRDGAVVFDGEIESLRRFKDDVREVAEGFECGIQIAKFQDLKEGDVIEAYALEHIAAELVRA